MTQTLHGDPQSAPEQHIPLKAPKSEPLDVSLGSAAYHIHGALITGGQILRFSGATIGAFRDMRHYFTEVLRQAGILIVSSGLIIWFMEFVVGYECGLEASYTLKQIGAPLYSGAFNAWCALREMSPYMWGYIAAAKIGCGMVAEIGSMRISNEIDAMEVMGIKSRSYLVGTRIAAAWLAAPFLYVVGLGTMYLGEYLTTVQLLGGVSSGGYQYSFWLYQNSQDLLYSLIKVMAMTTGIIFIACYYGYTARGGPVGVGRNTAKSMMLNMVWVHIVGLLGTQLFWGATPNLPIGS